MGQTDDARVAPLIKDEFWVINSTGPGLVSRTLAENQELAKTVTVIFPMMCVIAATGIASVIMVFI